MQTCNSATSQSGNFAMTSSSPAISVRHLSKRYQLGTIGRHTLVDEMSYFWHKLRGRDPRQHMDRIRPMAISSDPAMGQNEGAEFFWALRDISFDVRP